MVKQALIRCYRGSLKVLDQMGVNSKEVHRRLKAENRRIDAYVARSMDLARTYVRDHGTGKIEVSTKALGMSECPTIMAHELLHDVGRLPDHYWEAGAKCWWQQPCRWWRPEPQGECCIMSGPKGGFFGIGATTCKSLDRQCKEDLRKRGLLK